MTFLLAPLAFLAMAVAQNQDRPGRPPFGRSEYRYGRWEMRWAYDVPGAPHANVALIVGTRFNPLGIALYLTRFHVSLRIIMAAWTLNFTRYHKVPK